MTNILAWTGSIWAFLQGMSTTGENKKAVIGELLNNANPEARRVISAYNPDLKYQANLKNVKACKAAPLEESAKLLGLAPRG